MTRFPHAASDNAALPSHLTSLPRFLSLSLLTCTSCEPPCALTGPRGGGVGQNHVRLHRTAASGPSRLGGQRRLGGQSPGRGLVTWEKRDTWERSRLKGQSPGRKRDPGRSTVQRCGHSHSRLIRVQMHDLLPNGTSSLFTRW
eukprot:357650-Chlamydomonas_euryale.AAC.5